MTLLYTPIWRDDLFHVEQFALSAHFLQKSGRNVGLFIWGAGPALDFSKCCHASPAEKRKRPGVQTGRFDCLS
jgi:hypothetical protein